METSYEEVDDTAERSTSELRAEMFRILDELATARSDRAAVLNAEFKVLWDELRASEGATVH